MTSIGIWFVDTGTWIVDLIDRYPSTSRYLFGILALLAVMHIFEQLGV